MAYIPGKGWESVVTGRVEPIRGDDRGDPMVESFYARQALPGAGLGAGAGVIGFEGAQPHQVQPGVIGALPAVAAAAGVALPAWLLAILGTAAAGYAGYQALGGGEGGGLFGLNVLGGDEFAMGGLEFGGPGLPEPTEPYTEWHVGNKQFYYVKQYTSTGAFKNGKVAMYNKDTKRWKVWTLPKPSLAIIGKNRPSHRMLTRLRRNLSRQTADAKTILKITSPHSLERTRRPGGRWVPGKKRYID
ncbi:hypothetical protein ES703_109549 [subsurface metagenome]